MKDGINIITPESNIIRIETIKDNLKLLPKSLVDLILEYEIYFKGKLITSFVAHNILYYVRLLSDGRIISLGKDIDHKYSIKIWENNICIRTITISKEDIEITYMIITDIDDIVIAVKNINNSHIIKYDPNTGDILENFYHNHISPINYIFQCGTKLYCLHIKNNGFYMWHCDNKTTILFTHNLSNKNDALNYIGIMANKLYLIEYIILNIWNFSDKFECEKIKLEIKPHDYIIIIRPITETLISYGTYKGYLGILNIKTNKNLMKHITHNRINEIIIISDKKLLVVTTFNIEDCEIGVYDMEAKTFNILSDFEFKSEIHVVRLFNSKISIIHRNILEPKLTDIIILDIDRYDIENIIHINIDYNMIKNRFYLTPKIICGYDDGNICIYN